MYIKRFISALIIALIFTFSLTGCSNNKNSEIVGNWIPTTASLNGETVQYSYLGLDDNYFGFSFKANGTCTATLAGITGKGTYIFNGTSVDVTIDQEEPKKLTYDNGTLTLKLNYDDDVTTFSFIKTKNK